MPPRHHTLPAPQTSSAKEAMSAFYCQLCSKGYTRMNDYEAHLSSYDHTHRQRLKDMKQMVKGDTSRVRKAEAKADGLISIKLGGETSTGGGGFKKGGFKKTGFKAAFTPVGAGGDKKKEEEAKESTEVLREDLRGGAKTADESDTEDGGYEVYNPRFPTD